MFASTNMKQIKCVLLMKKDDILTEIREWAESSSSYLSESSAYASGYKEAVIYCKERILEILNRGK